MEQTLGLIQKENESLKEDRVKHERKIEQLEQQLSKVAKMQCYL